MAFQILVILTGLVVGWFKRGSVWNIPNIRMKIIWLLPVSYLLQQISIHKLEGLPYEVLLIASYLMLIWFCVQNVRITGIKWALAGTTSNFLVMLVNGLRMPAYLKAVKVLDPSAVPLLKAGKWGKSVAMIPPHTHFNFLGDIFTFNIYPASLISVGDILFAIGLVLVIQHAMMIPLREERPLGQAAHT